LPWDPPWCNVSPGLPDKGSRDLAEAALAEVGLGDRLDDWPRNLSRGQAQRVALARALVQQPQLLLLDEPFTALEAQTRVRMQSLVKALMEKHRPGVLLVTHDVDEAITLGDRALVMRDGAIARDYAISIAARGHRSHPEAIRLRDDLLADLGVEANA
jgi:sulfonate transport system ATP-binding protein